MRHAHSFVGMPRGEENGPNAHHYHKLVLPYTYLHTYNPTGVSKPAPGAAFRDQKFCSTFVVASLKRRNALPVGF